jgi:hypothetical protein
MHFGYMVLSNFYISVTEGHSREHFIDFFFRICEHKLKKNEELDPGSGNRLLHLVYASLSHVYI